MYSSDIDMERACLIFQMGMSIFLFFIWLFMVVVSLLED